MDLFPDGAFVRLRSRGNRKYVHADADWEGVSLRSRGSGDPSKELEAVWRVEHWAGNQGGVFVRLQSAAYGRYLSLSPQEAPPGHLGLRAVQSDLAEPNLVNIYFWRWRVERAHPLRDFVRLRHFDRDLRANGRYLRRNAGVSVDANRGRRLSTMMQWTVHLVDATSVPIPLRAPPPPPQEIQGGRRGLLFWRHSKRGPEVLQPPAQAIRHVRASDEGNFDQNHHNWASFDAVDRSVFNLRTHLGQLQPDWDGEMFGFTLCIRPGSHGRLMPLVTDLPRSIDPICIVVLRTGSPAAEALRYPIL